ncbi:MAG: M23 family metallopeptidase [Firmicutes bacterium]|nr:M23 family metallopeptidase [Bacillota bacterium]
MDDVIVRAKYSRNTPPYRRKRLQAKESNTLGEIVKRQILISILIFIIILSIKNINTSITNFIIDKVKWTLLWNIDINDIYRQINNIIEGEENTGYENNSPMENDNQTKNEKQIQDENSSENSESIELEFILPIEGVVSSYFGERIDPVTNKIKFHSGIDIEGDESSQIKAVEDGEVIEISEHRMYGKYVKIRHLGGIISLYAHCSRILIEEGMKASKGDIIAEVGNTGVSTGTHLHFEVWKDGKPVDPLEFIKVPIKTDNKNEVL